MCPTNQPQHLGLPLKSTLNQVPWWSWIAELFDCGRYQKIFILQQIIIKISINFLQKRELIPKATNESPWLKSGKKNKKYETHRKMLDRYFLYFLWREVKKMETFFEKNSHCKILAYRLIWNIWCNCCMNNSCNEFSGSIPATKPPEII